MKPGYPLSRSKASPNLCEEINSVIKAEDLERLSRLTMSSSDEEGQGNFVFYKDREEWKDVEPFPSDEGPDPVVSIDYSEQFADVYDYIRGVIRSGEHSPRVLSLTCDAISLNAANYTVWQLRRDVLEGLNVPKLIDENGLDEEFEKEFEFCERMIENNQKNYQVWHHQKALVTWAVGYNELAKTMKVTNPDHQTIVFNRELKLTTHILTYDAKNYHAWQHRQWILSVFKDFSNEMEYIDTLLNEDVRNNSAWNQRHFVFVNLRNFSLDVLLKELDATWVFIKYAICNESPWSYIRGLLNLNEDFRITLEKQVVRLSKELMSQSDIHSVPMLALYIEVADDLLRNNEGDLDLYNEIIALLQSLKETIDPIRKRYWEYIKDKFISANSDRFNIVDP